jgi:sulfonate transport system permease protein
MTLFDETRQGQQDKVTVQHATTSVTLNADQGQEADEIGKPVRSVRRRRLKATFPYGLVLPVLIIAFWELASLVGWTDPTTLPAPTTVISTLVGLILDGTLGGDLLASTLRWAVGFLIGGTLGLFAGSFVGLSRIAERALDTSVQMLRTIPFLALAPLLVLWMGLDEPPKITLIALASFFPLYINTFAGIRNVDRKLIEIGRVYRLSPSEMLLRVILPAALPEILTGVRYALSVAWLALVLAELLGAQQGLGYLLAEGREFVRVDIVLCSILIFALAGKLVDLLVRGLEAYFLRWRDTYKG